MSRLRIVRTRAFLPIFIITAIGVTIDGVANAVGTLFAINLNATIAEIGLISLASGVSSIVATIPFGVLTDKLGRKSVILLTQSLAIASNLILITSTTPWHLIAASVVGTMCVFVPSFLSLLVNIGKPEDRAEITSLFYFFYGIGMFIGPGIASILLIFMGIKELYYISLAARLGLIVFVVLAVREAKITTRRRESRTSLGKVATLLKKKNLITAFITGFSLFFCYILLRMYMPVYALSLGLSDSEIAALFTFSGITNVITRLFVGAMIAKLTLKRLLLMMNGALILGGILIPFSQGFLSMSLIMLLYGVTIGAVPTACGFLVMSSSTPDERGTAHSIYTVGVVLPSMVAPIVMTPLAENWGSEYTFPFGVILPIVAAILTPILIEPLLKEQDNESTAA